MTPTPKRAETLPPADEAAETNLLANSIDFVEPSFDQEQWQERTVEERGSGGRQVLAGALAVLAALWLAYAAWSAGRTLAGQPLSSPLITQWIAIAAGPLAIMGLAWLMFGRTRRKEAERFTRSVITMRSEARSLEALLEVLSQRIQDSRTELTMIAQHLMKLGDEATGKLGGITREFDSSSEKLMRHGEALDRAAGSARVDIAVLLEDLPQAEQTARAVAEQLRLVGTELAEKTAVLGRQVSDLAERTRSADQMVAQVVSQLSERFAEIETASTSAAARVGEAESAYSGTLDTLLERTAISLEQIRSGIDAQSAAVAALVAQASAGIGKAGADAAESLAANLDHANSSLESLSSRVAEQDRASQSMIAEIERGLALIDQRFTELAANGDERANHFLEFADQGAGRARLDGRSGEQPGQCHRVARRAHRVAAREHRAFEHRHPRERRNGAR